MRKPIEKYQYGKDAKPILIKLSKKKEPSRLSDMNILIGQLRKTPTEFSLKAWVYKTFTV